MQSVYKVHSLIIIHHKCTELLNICTCSAIHTEPSTVAIVRDCARIDNHVVADVFQVDSMLSVVTSYCVIHVELILCL